MNLIARSEGLVFRIWQAEFGLVYFLTVNYGPCNRYLLYRGLDLEKAKNLANEYQGLTAGSR